MNFYWRNLISKWLNFICFAVLDFITVGAIVLLQIENVGTNSEEALIFGIKVTTAFDLRTQLWILPTIWILTIIVRFSILLISVQKSFQNPNITCLFDAKNPYNIPMPAQVSLFSLGVPIEELHQMILQYVRFYELKLDKVYINISGLPNAFTVIIPVPFLRKRIVVLNSNILGLMSKREIEALFMQEVAHMRTSNSTLRTIFTSPRLFLQFMYWYVYFRIFLASLQFLEYNNIFASDFFRFSLGLAFLVVTYLFFRITELITLGFLQRSNRAAEYLADRVMLDRVGRYIAINMLIKMGLRLSSIQAFYEEIRWLHEKDENPLLASSIISRKQRLSEDKFIDGILDYFPLDIVDPIEARKKAPSIYLRWKFHRLRENLGVELTNSQIKRITSNAASKLMKAREKKMQDLDISEKPYSFQLEEKLTEYNISLPQVRQGELLSHEEIENFINTLEGHRELIFFEDKFHSGGIENHPRIEKRIRQIWNQNNMSDIY